MTKLIKNPITKSMEKTVAEAHYLLYKTMRCHDHIDTETWCYLFVTIPAELFKAAGLSCSQYGKYLSKYVKAVQDHWDDESCWKDVK